MASRSPMGAGSPSKKAPRRTLPNASALPAVPADRLLLVLFLLVLWTVLALRPARAGEVQDWSLAASFNLASDSFAGASTLPRKRGPASQTLEIGSVPFKIGTQEAAAGTGWRSVAGAEARYSLPLATALSVTARAKATQTSFVDDPTRDLIQGSSVLDFRYAAAGWTFGLIPGLDLLHRATGADQHDLGLEGRVSRALVTGVDLTTAAKLRWRQADGTAPASEALSGRVGLVCALPYSARLDVGYSLRHEQAEAGVALAANTTARGPTVDLAVPLSPQAALSARYRLASTTRDFAVQPEASYAEERHQLGLKLLWDLGGNRTDLRLSANYTFEHVDLAGPDPDASRHTGTLSLALGF